jgi:hypothetical protein
MPDTEEALSKQVNNCGYPRESVECRFADRKVGISLSETLMEKPLSRVNAAE